MSGIYVHLPWCVSKCPYCDFNSHQANGRLSEIKYVESLLLDLEGDVARFPRTKFESIFIGGGTPSLFSGKAVDRLLNGIRDRVVLKKESEITLEANPGSADSSRFEGYMNAGVNRISIGVQSFNDRTLKAIGRKHSGSEAKKAVEIAKCVGFENFNLDLMFGLPEASKGDAVSDLEQALVFDPPHISWYQLTLEENTAFARKLPVLPTHNEICDEFEIGQKLLAKNKFLQYEVSAYAKKNMTSTHNMNYWTFGDYLGIGAGAHGKISHGSEIIRTEKIRKPESYMKAIENGQAPGTESEIAPSRRAGEYMLNALRLKDGFSLTDCTLRLSVTGFDKKFEENIKTACEKGLLSRTNDWIKPTSLGYRFLNDLQLIFV